MAQPYKWDILVKLTHWTVAALFFCNYFLTEKGSTLHQWVGYAVVGAIAIRLIWGLIASSPARLTSFKPSIPSALAHIKETLVTKRDDHVGHNPAGAIMIWTMWTLLLSTALTGWATEQNFWGAKDSIGDFHEILANITMTAVTIHVSAVILMTKLTGNSYFSGIALWRRKANSKANKPQQNSDDISGVS